jgi:hypothetical protein
VKAGLAILSSSINKQSSNGGCYLMAAVGEARLKYRREKT